MSDELAMALKNIPSPMRLHLRAGRFAAARQAMWAGLLVELPNETERAIAWGDFQWVLRHVYHEPQKER